MIYITACSVYHTVRACVLNRDIYDVYHDITYAEQHHATMSHRVYTCREPRYGIYRIFRYGHMCRAKQGAANRARARVSIHTYMRSS